MPKFIPGLKLCELFYQKEVRPILRKNFPNLRYSAAVLGWGSEVLGFDTPLSRDHHWGPRVLLFLDQEDYPKLKDAISESLSNNLPYEFMGYWISFRSEEHTSELQSRLHLVCRLLLEKKKKKKNI